jgi:hypothetical protein
MNLSFFSWFAVVPVPAAGAVPAAEDENDIVGVVSKLKEGLTIGVTLGVIVGVTGTL